MKTIATFYFSIFLLFLVEHIAAAVSSATYSVVGLPSSENVEFGVLIDNDNIYRLSPSTEDPTILFQVEAPIAQRNYRFVELDKKSDNVTHKEEFERNPIDSKINQIYGRSWTIKPVRTLERVYGEVGYRQKTDLHLTDEISSVHIEAGQEEIDHIHDHYNQKIKIKVNTTFIGAQGVRKFSDVKLSIAGRSTRFRQKLSYNIKLAEGDNLGGYRSLKLKASTDDPSFLRNKLYFDMMIAAGLPGTRLSYKRVYLNNVALGLFIFTEKYDDTWFDLNANPGLSDYKNGVLYAGTGRMVTRIGEFTDLSYLGEDPKLYGKHEYKIVLEDKSEKKGFTSLAKFIKFIDDQLKTTAVSNNAGNEKGVIAKWGKYIGEEIFLRSSNNEKKVIAEWDKHVNAEVFLRSMVFEFLATAWDSYLSSGNNYFLYKSPVQHNFVYLDWDQEFTFGNSFYPKHVQLEGDYHTVDGIQNRPLAKALLRVPYFRKYFEKTLEKIVHSILDPRVSFPVIDSLAEFLREDVAWDRSIPRVNADKDFNNPPKGDPKEGEFIVKKPHSLPPFKDTNMTLVKELNDPNREKVDFQTMIDGPTSFGSLMGLKEFIQGKYDNVNKHI